MCFRSPIREVTQLRPLVGGLLSWVLCLSQVATHGLSWIPGLGVACRPSLSTVFLWGTTLAPFHFVCFRSFPPAPSTGQLKIWIKDWSAISVVTCLVHLKPPYWCIEHSSFYRGFRLSEGPSNIRGRIPSLHSEWVLLKGLWIKAILSTLFWQRYTMSMLASALCWHVCGWLQWLVCCIFSSALSLGESLHDGSGSAPHMNKDTDREEKRTQGSSLQQKWLLT